MLIGISGYQKSGKDTVANILKNKYGYYKYNLAEPLYKMALQLYPNSCLKSYFDNIGVWNDEQLENQKRLFKETEFSDGFYGRTLLQQLGDVARKSDRYVFCKLADNLLQYHSNLVIPDIRTEDELRWLQNKQGVNKNDSILIYVAREGIENKDLHETESYQDRLEENANYLIWNFGSLKDLENKVDLLLSKISK